MKLKSYFWSVLICIISMISSCKDETKTDDIETNEPEKVESEYAGDFIVINTRTNDTLTVIGNSESDVEEITAHAGDTIKITFNPENIYKDYYFKTAYTFPNDREGWGKEYEYIVTSLPKGIYGIDLEASSSDSTDDKVWDLTANGKFNLKIVSYANIDYKLFCPSVLLEYATPQITYVGNDGIPVTFTIPESDWEEYVIPDDWDIEEEITVIVIDGDTIVSEPTKTMQWTKHVEYDDFSVVDDEMTVAYIPKDNIPNGNVNEIEGLSPWLSSHLEFVSDDGRYQKPMIIGIDVSISVGSHARPLSDIISNHHNYRGFHVESNGTYDTKKEGK